VEFVHDLSIASTRSATRSSMPGTLTASAFQSAAALLVGNTVIDLIALVQTAAFHHQSSRTGVEGRSVFCMMMIPKRIEPDGIRHFVKSESHAIGRV
jgi:hypothetical protein